MFVSVVIPTYNRLSILQKCLLALENQKIFNEVNQYEVLVVDDGSDDGTCSFLENQSDLFSHVRLIRQNHAGPGAARNKGVLESKGEVIVFIDSDLVVTDSFLESHASSLRKAWLRRGNRICFTYGGVVNTSNYDEPTSERFKFSDLSWAYFATGNVAIDKNLLNDSGLFDPAFSLYGWEDLELGERLRQMGTELIRCPKAVGYHWHPALTIDQIPTLVRIEIERAKMAIVFYRKHPTIRVRCIIQFTLLHRFIWETLTVGGLINEFSLRPLLKFLIKRGYPGFAMELLRIPLNRINVRQIYREASLNRFY